MIEYIVVEYLMIMVMVMVGVENSYYYCCYYDYFGSDYYFVYDYYYLCHYFDDQTIDNVCCYFAWSLDSESVGIVA